MWTLIEDGMIVNLDHTKSISYEDDCVYFESSTEGDEDIITCDTSDEAKELFEIYKKQLVDSNMLNLDNQRPMSSDMGNTKKAW